MVKTVKDAWRQGEVASILFLDVKSMFPSTAIDCLFHKMLLLGIPVEYTKWLYRHLEGQKTWLTFDDFPLELFRIASGLDQGDPFLLICYLIYDASLLNIPIKENGESGSLYVMMCVSLLPAKTSQ
jgi:hypothetical protein